jgi:hypothetical protein
MATRFFIALLMCLLFSSASLAQRPIIDSMKIDELSDQLRLYGRFGYTIGAVYVDSVSIPITLKSPDSIIAKLPRSGRGFAGPVVVGANGERSEAHVISMLAGKLKYDAEWSSDYSGWPQERASQSVTWNLVLRVADGVFPAVLSRATKIEWSYHSQYTMVIQNTATYSVFDGARWAARHEDSCLINTNIRVDSDGRLRVHLPSIDSVEVEGIAGRNDNDGVHEREVYSTRDLPGLDCTFSPDTNNTWRLDSGSIPNPYLGKAHNKTALKSDGLKTSFPYSASLAVGESRKSLAEEIYYDRSSKSIVIPPSWDVSSIYDNLGRPQSILGVPSTSGIVVNVKHFTPGVYYVAGSTRRVCKVLVY